MNENKEIRWVISHTLLNIHCPSATPKQTLAHWPFTFITSVSHTKNKKITSQSLIYIILWFEKSAFKPYFAKGFEGGTRERGDPLLKIFGTSPSFILFFFILVIIFYLDILWLCYVRINLYSDFNSWPWIDPN